MLNPANVTDKASVKTKANCIYSSTGLYLWTYTFWENIGL